jgi:hypothetical protein
MLDFTNKNIIPLEMKVVKFLVRPVETAKNGDTRFHVGHIKVEPDGSAVGTDGNRLHHVSCFHYKGVQVEPGYYRILKRTKTEVWIDRVSELDEPHGYPPYEELMNYEPEKTVNFELTLTTEFIPMFGAFAELTRCTPRGQCFNFYYFADICELIDGEVSVCLKIDKHWQTEEPHIEKPVIFERVVKFPDENGEVVLTALLMPVRL